LSIPYQETRNLDPGYPIREHNYGNIGFTTWEHIEFPWRTINQEIYFNISVFNATISLQIIYFFDLGAFMLGEPYDPYWKVNNITVFENTIQITPSYQGLIYIIVAGDEITGDEGSILLYSEITVTYFRYASNYGFVFLGIAVILISSYSYRRYKWK
jgi:hypothetical protein